MPTKVAPKGQKPPGKLPFQKSQKTNSDMSNGQDPKNAATILFEEKIYNGAKIRTLNDSQIQQASAAANELLLDRSNTEKAISAPKLVTLPSAIRSCWPDLFPSVSSAKKSIRKGAFFVRRQTGSDNNEKELELKGKCDTKVFIGDTIFRKVPNYLEPRFRSRGPSTEEIIGRAVGGKLRIAYLDKDLAIVVKPHGMPGHKFHAGTNHNNGDDDDGDQKTNQKSTEAKDINNDDNSSRLVSMHELLLHCLPTSGGTDVLRRPAAVHRLDRPTYGLLVVARTRPCARFLSKVFEERPETLVKRYRAIVHGHMKGLISNEGKPRKGSGTFIRTPLGGKECISEYFIVNKLVAVGHQSTKLESSGLQKQKQQNQQPNQPMYLTLVDLILHTGRKHQLRRHLASLGHPIAGDSRYGNVDAEQCLSMTLGRKSKTLMLAAVEITFLHPISTKSPKAKAPKMVPRREDVTSRYSVLANDSTTLFDASKGTLNVSIAMPESMMQILRNTETIQDSTTNTK